MNNTEALKEILKEPLCGDKQLTERIAQFLMGVFDAGRIVGFREGYATGKCDSTTERQSDN